MKTNRLIRCLIIGASVALTHVTNITAAEFTEAVEKTVLGLEETGRQKFLRGDGNWDDLMADGAYMVGWDGKITIYQKGHPLPAAPMKSIALSDLKARVYGDVVVVTGLGEGAGETPDKKPFSFQSRFLNVWKKSDDGTWKIVVTQNTAVKQQPAK